MPMNVDGLSQYPGNLIPTRSMVQLETSRMYLLICRLLRIRHHLADHGYEAQLSNYHSSIDTQVRLLSFTVLLSSGVKESSRMNNIFTGVNLCIVTFIIVCGAIKADFHNWSISPSELPTNWSNHSNVTRPCNSTKTCGEGGFFPFGFSGMLAGAAKCFYAFVGFDCIATTGRNQVSWLASSLDTNSLPRERRGGQKPSKGHSNQHCLGAHCLHGGLLRRFGSPQSNCPILHDRRECSFARGFPCGWMELG